MTSQLRTPLAILAMAFTFGAYSLPRVQSHQMRPPNLIFVLADDLGWTDLACCGSKFYETPNLDRLAAQGTRFTSAYTCGPNCAPTRAGLVSGQYGPRTGIYTVGTGARGQEQFRKMIPVENQTELPLDKVTVAQALQRAGYATAMFGKWHLGQQGAHHPAKRGFDEAITSMGRHFEFATQPPTSVPADKYLADWLTDKAVDFIERKQDRPFFIYLTHFAVHVPHQAKAELTARFRGKSAVGGHHDPVYAAMIASLDESMGRLMAKLDELKLADNTVLIFSSDNGGVGGYREAGLRGGGAHTNNAPLRGGKGMLYEGGVRVPLIVRWPRATKPRTVCDEPVASVDFYPTFLELAAAKRDANYTLDGVSFVPLLKDPRAQLSRDALYWHFPGYLEAGASDFRTTPAGAIRMGDWKLLEFFEEGRLELYNLRADPGQKTELSQKMPEKRTELHEKLVAWRKSVQAPMPKVKGMTLPLEANQ